MREDAVGEVLVAVEGGVEGEIGARGDVIDDLHHCAPLVGAARSEVLDDIDVGGRRQRSVRFVRGRTAKIVEAVGEHANSNADTIDAQSALIQGFLPPYEVQIDAMVIAQAQHLSNYKRYFGLLPPGWDFDDTNAAYYEQQAMR